jgi:hypothetical protein
LPSISGSSAQAPLPSKAPALGALVMVTQGTQRVCVCVRVCVFEIMIANIIHVLRKHQSKKNGESVKLKKEKKKKKKKKN